MKKYFSFLLLVTISLVFLTGCVTELVVPENGIDSPESEGDFNDENLPDMVGSGKGTLKVYLTNVSGGYKDPPGSFDEEYLEINISISRIEGHIAGDEEVEVEVEKGDGYWATLMSWDLGYEIDLMDIENVSVLLASLNLKPNKYTQLRIFLDEEASLVLLRNGVEVTEILEIPSSDQTGIKLNHPFEIVEGMLTKLTILFDAEKSVIKTGNGKYKMKPVISLSSETYSTGEVPEGTGSVSGSVSYYTSTYLALTGIEGAEIELTGGVYTFANTTVTLVDGTFSLAGVPAGIYMFNVYTDDYDDYSESVVIANGGNTVVDVVFLVEEPGGISGSVVVEGTTSAIEGATVTVTLAGGSTYSFESSTETDSEGSFSIEQLPVGTYDLLASADTYDDNNILGIAVTADAINDISEIGLMLTPQP